MEKIKFYTKPTISSTPELKMVIDVSGNVGIGESNPTKALEVVGDISFNGDLYQNGAPFQGGTLVNETTDISLNNLNVHGDLSANDASFNNVDIEGKLQISSTNTNTDDTNGTKFTFSKIESGNYVNIGALAGHGDNTGGGVVLYNLDPGESFSGGYVSTSSSYAFYAPMSGEAGYWSSGNFGWSATFTGDRHLANSPYIDHGQSNVKFIVNNPGSSVKIRWRSSFNDSGKGLYYSASTSNANYTRHTTSTSWQERELNHGIWFGWNSGSSIQYEVYILPNIPAYTTAPSLKPNIILNENGNLGVGKVNDVSGVMHDYKKMVVYQTGTGHGIYSEGSATQTNYAFSARNSSGNDSWAIRYDGTTAISSDDRLKHNEMELTNSLDIINRLKPVRYFKTAKMFDKNFNFELDTSGNPITSEIFHIETGLIAQEVNTIPELQYCVGGGSNEITGDQPYNVNYNDIFVYNIAATKELHQLVESQQQEITNLKQENATLTQRLQTIEQHLGI